jgi:excisionase family DNA binding protein
MSRRDCENEKRLLQRAAPPRPDKHSTYVRKQSPIAGADDQRCSIPRVALGVAEGCNAADDDSHPPTAQPARKKLAKQVPYHEDSFVLLPARAGPDRRSNERLAYSPDEAAKLVGVGRTFLYAALRDGELVSHKIGARRLITRAALEAWLAAHISTAVP